LAHRERLYKDIHRRSGGERPDPSPGRSGDQPAAASLRSRLRTGEPKVQPPLVTTPGAAPRNVTAITEMSMACSGQTFPSLSRRFQRRPSRRLVIHPCRLRAASRRLGRSRSRRLLRSGGTRTRGIPITDDPMAYDNGKRLLLYALVKGLGDAVRRNDQSAAKR